MFSRDFKKKVYRTNKKTWRSRTYLSLVHKSNSFVGSISDCNNLRFHQIKHSIWDQVASLSLQHGLVEVFWHVLMRCHIVLCWHSKAVGGLHRLNLLINSLHFRLIRLIYNTTYTSQYTVCMVSQLGQLIQYFSNSTIQCCRRNTHSLKYLNL